MTPEHEDGNLIRRPATYTYEPDTNVAYIELGGPISPGGVARTAPVYASVNVDFDADDTVIGLEIYGPWPDGSAVATSDDDPRAEVARLRAGESDTPRIVGTAPTPAQWIRGWNDLTPERRLRKAAMVLDNAEQASRCFLMGHEGDAKELQETIKAAYDRRELLTSHFRLAGDENCGVGIHCRDCEDGGRPLAYYDSSGDRFVDPLVPNVTTIPDLLEAAWRHRADAHSGEVRP